MRNPRRIVFCILLVVLTLLAQTPTAPDTYQLPLWSAHTWIYPALGAGFVVTGNTVSVTPSPAPAFAPNSVWALTAAQTSFTLTCPVADVYRNGLLMTSSPEGGADFSVDPTGLIITFSGAQIPQAGDLVKILYRCAKPSQ